MHLHILGICGTFMGGIAAIAQALGHKVTGSDANVYPPMSTQLEQLGIDLYQGWDVEQFATQPDLVVIGNALSRGNPAVEYVLDRNLPYTSGPQWLLENLLKDRWVLAASGTHGKTTTSSMLAWILEYAGFEPGFLIGGVPENFGISARLGKSPFFVIEADEYDSAFFDKRSKFVHYRPKTLIANNLEFDHADIFDSLKDIQKQFHHLIRMIPQNGLILSPAADNNLEDTLNMGCWSPVQKVGKEWNIGNRSEDGSHFEVLLHDKVIGEVNWQLIGDHNISNGIMAIAAARHAGIDTSVAIEALSEFKNVKRRMELKAKIGDICLYDDFAHHPTAIETTLQGLRAKTENQRILAVLEPRSNTMKMGVHEKTLVKSWQLADKVYIFKPQGLTWSLDNVIADSDTPVTLSSNIDELVSEIAKECQPFDQILVMSNGGFGGIHQKLQSVLEKKYGL